MPQSIKLVGIDKIKRQLHKAALKALYPRIVKGAKNARRYLIPAFINSLKRTNVMKQLSGHIILAEVNDLRAHLGLSEDDAMHGYDAVINLVSEVLRASNPKITSKNIVFGFSFPKLADHVAGLDVSYQSENSDGDFTTIPWMKWLIKGGSVSAFITFDIGDNFEVIRKSRSTRAFMIDGHGQWDIDDYDRFALNSNFLVDALRDPKWIEDSERITLREIKKAVQG